MTSEGLGEMFEGDSADTCARKFPLMLIVSVTSGKDFFVSFEDFLGTWFPGSLLKSCPASKIISDSGTLIEFNSQQGWYCPQKQTKGAKDFIFQQKNPKSINK